MKTLKKNFFTILSIIFLFSACDNAETLNNSNNSNKSIDPTTIVCDLTLNEENPYNYVGSLHNEILSTYLSTYTDDTTDIAVILSRIQEIGDNNTTYSQLMDSNYQLISSSVVSEAALDFENEFVNVIDNMEISTEAKDKLSEMINYFFSIAKQSTSPTFDEVDDVLRSFESEVIGLSFDETENRVLLSFIATARYSSCFWYQYFDVANYDYDTKAETEPEPKRKWYHWVIIGVSDAVGAGLGSIPAAGTLGVGGAAIVAGACTASTLAYNMTNPKTK